MTSTQTPLAGRTPAPQKIPHEVWVLVAAAFIIALGYGLVAPVIPQFATSFGVGMAAAGAVVSVFAGTRLIFAPASGSLIDALGSRWVYLTGLILVAVSTGLVACAQEYWHMLALRALAGCGSTMFTVSAAGLIISLSPPEIRGRCSSAYASGFLFGNIGGPIIGAALSVLGMRWPFIIYGVMVALAAFVVWWRMPRTIGARATRGAALPVVPVREVLHDRAFLAALVGAFANGWSNFGVRVATVPLFAAAVFDNGAAIAGLAMTAFAAGNAVALQFSGRLSDRIGRRPLIIAGLVVNAAFTATFGFSHQFATLLAVSAGAGFGAGLLNPSQQAVIADIVGPERSGGKVVAAYQMTQDLGTIVGPILIGSLAHTVGFGSAFIICAAISTIAAIAWLFGRETRTARV